MTGGRWVLVVSSPAEVKAENKSSKLSQELSGSGTSVEAETLLEYKPELAITNSTEAKGAGRSGGQKTLQVEFRNGQEELGWYLESEVE